MAINPPVDATQTPEWAALQKHYDELQVEGVSLKKWFAEDAERVVASVSGIPYINIGNYGRIAPEKPGMPRKRYGNNIYCDQVEVESFKHLIATGLKCIYQTTPEEPAEDITNLFK